MLRSSHKKFFRLYSVITICELFLTTAFPALAISIPSASSWASDIERRYNLNTDALREQGQSFNVADQKKISPEVSLFFTPSDPKVGEKITAIASPIYFSSAEEDMYYTWYLKYAGCDLKNGPLTATETNRCDRDQDGDITVEDWKIEAARIIAAGNYSAPASYTGLTDTDNDGYRARFGGDNKVGVANYCYYHDKASGEFYEIAEADTIDFTSCNAGEQAVCLVTNETALPDTITGTATGGSGGSGGTGGGTPGGGTGGTGGNVTISGDTFIQGTNGSAISGIPYCAGSGVPQCNVGTPCCVSNPTSGTFPATCTNPLTTCDPSTASNANPYCRHLFPNAPGGAFSGNGNFNISEEEFWRTDPNDPDTADNGNKDEANVVGLGRSRFSWNYSQGDLVGVAVEGTSMLATKHDDASGMIMWAFSKNTCPFSATTDTGAYTKSIRNYAVTIPTVEIDLNDCLEANLVDPTAGGQATTLDVSVSATPENPQDDTTGKKDGDLLEVTASVDNAARGLPDTFFDWRVEISPTGTSNPTTWTNITNTLTNLPGNRNLLSTVRGNGVNVVRLKLDMELTDLLGGFPLSNVGPPGPTYLIGDSGYLRFRVDVRENFAGGTNRKGSGSVIVKFFTSQNRIRAYIVSVNGNPATVSLTNNEICSGVVNPLDPLDKQALDKLESKICRVIENEIIGLSLDNPNNTYSNFNWMINGKPLVCNTKVSPNCFDDRQGSINFFPVIGEAGDTVTISLTANEINLNTSTEQTITLSRIFRIVTPAVEIVSNDLSLAWPKVLGQYFDANGNAFTDLSKNTLQALPATAISLRANFIPTFLEILAPPLVERSWMVDDTPLGDLTSGTVRTTPPVINTPVTFTTNKPEGSIYNVALSVVYRPSQLIRKALSDIWGISVLDATEQYFGSVTQLEHLPGDYLAKKTGPQKYLALLSSYLPTSVLFSLRVFLSIALILFVAGVVFSLLPASTVPSSGRRRF